MRHLHETPLSIEIPIEVFDIPVHEIRRGYRSDVYFWRAKRTLEKSQYQENATIQVFQKQRAVLCGVEEALAIVIWVLDITETRLKHLNYSTNLSNQKDESGHCTETVRTGSVRPYVRRTRSARRWTSNGSVISTRFVFNL